MLSVLPSSLLTLSMAPQLRQPVLAGRHAVASCAIARVLDAQPARAPLFAVRMQEPAIDTDSMSFYDEFRRSDPGVPSRSFEHARR